VNDTVKTIKLSSGIMTDVTDKAVVDATEGTYVWDYSQEDCPDTMVQLYVGELRVFTNTTSSFEGGIAFVEAPDSGQVAGLELVSSFVMCGRAALHTHIKNIFVFLHALPGMQVASGKFVNAPGERETTRLESEIGFHNIKANMKLADTVRQVKAEICLNRRAIAQTRLEAIADANLKARDAPIKLNKGMQKTT
jgi:hypothetical protein